MTTESDQQAGTWRSAAALGFSKYEASPDGFGPDQQPVRRQVAGTPLKVKTGTNGRPQVKPYDDDNKQRTLDVGPFVLRTFAGPCPPGMECRHYDDDSWNNRWRPGSEAESVAAGGNLFWGSKPQNVEDGFRNGRPRAAPRPVRHCVMPACGAVLTTNGKRCHDCVVILGETFAALIRGGQDPADIAVEYDYRSAEAVVNLAVVHGGYGQPRIKRWLQRVHGWFSK